MFIVFYGHWISYLVIICTYIMCTTCLTKEACRNHWERNLAPFNLLHVIKIKNKIEMLTWSKSDRILYTSKTFKRFLLTNPCLLLTSWYQQSTVGIRKGIATNELAPWDPVGIKVFTTQVVCSTLLFHVLVSLAAFTVHSTSSRPLRWI